MQTLNITGSETAFFSKQKRTCKMQLEISTPALLFPAITLLVLAYTNRFLAVSSLIRNLHAKVNLEGKDKRVMGQIKNLRTRVELIRAMQALAVLSFSVNVASMFAFYSDVLLLADYLFGAGLLFLLFSLILCLIEIHISTKALNIDLSDMEEQK